MKRRIIEDVVIKCIGMVIPKNTVINSNISGIIPVMSRTIHKDSQNKRGLNPILPRRYCLKVIIKKAIARTAAMML